VIFLDFVLTQIREGVDTVETRPGANDPGLKLLLAALKRAEENHVAVVLADFPSGETPRNCPNGGSGSGADKRSFYSVHILFACAATAVAPVLWTAEDGAYPLVVGNNKLRSPAAEIFALLEHAGADRKPAKTDAASGHGGAHSVDTPLAKPASHAAEHEMEAMLVAWGPGGFATAETCHFGIHPRGTSMQWWAQLWKLWITTLLPSGEEFEPERELCLFSNRLSAASLLSDAHRTTRDMKLQGRVVMVGPAWETVPDTVVSPVQGRIPGV